MNTLLPTLPDTARPADAAPARSQPDPSHCLRVAQLVEVDFQCPDEEVRMAALLHDVLDFNPSALEGLRQSVGSKVTSWVERLSWRHHGSTATYWDRLVEAPWQVRLVKIADAFDGLMHPSGWLERRLRTASLAASLNHDRHPSLTNATAALRELLQRSRQGGFHAVF